MIRISEILSKKEVIKKEEKKEKPINETWEKADEFAKYLGLKTPFVLRLFKKFGEAKVLSLRSWVKDTPHSKSLEGLITWKLKQLNND